MEKKQTRTLAIAESRQLEGDTFGMVVAANNVGRDEIDLDLSAGDFTNYRKNPVVFWNHESGGPFASTEGLPIGRTLEIGHDAEGRIVARFEFLPEDPFAARVANAFRRGFVRAASIRFMGELEESGGRLRMPKWELLEWSLVGIPADPDAVRSNLELAARSLDIPEEVLGRTAPKPKPPEPEPVAAKEPEPKDELVRALGERVEALEVALGLREPPEPELPPDVVELFNDAALAVAERE